jgi:hypothetical protein
MQDLHCRLPSQAVKIGVLCAWFVAERYGIAACNASYREHGNYRGFKCCSFK